MDPIELQRRLRGIIAFTPTPFTGDDRVDLDGLGAHIDALCGRGACEIVVVCGGVGEFFSLRLDEYRECMRVAVAAAGGRLPVLVGIGHSTPIACDLAGTAEEVGAAGLMIHPAYFIEPSEAGLLHHYRALAQATNLGLMAFSTKGAVYTPDMIERLAEVPTVIALKDEYGDLRLFTEMVERLGPRLTWVNGMAEALAAPYCAAGAQAMTSGIVNIAPNLSRAVWEASAAGDWAAAQRLVAKLRPLIRLRERRRGYQIAVIKEAMNLLGRPGGMVRSPLTPLTPDDRCELRTALGNLGLLDPSA